MPILKSICQIFSIEFLFLCIYRLTEVCKEMSREVPHKPPPVLTSCNYSTIFIKLTQTTSFAYTHLRVYMQIYVWFDAIQPHVQLCIIIPQSRHLTLPTPQNSLVLSLYSYTHLPSLTHGNYQSILQLCNYLFHNCYLNETKHYVSF